jgi:tRNA A-37 threonylcarbamoyl transferase component Bud32
MAQDSSSSGLLVPENLPGELCGYLVDSSLNADQTYLAIGPGGRGVVLKKLDPDCLLRGLLHPSIRERLACIRELAHGGVANLYGVGREGDSAYLIWEYLPGQTIDDYLSQPQRTGRDLLMLARELILGVDALHMRGIVHGAIAGGNVIVAPDGSVRLTHLSPLLYSDVAADVESVIALLRQAVERRGEQRSPVGELLAEATREQMGLRELGVRLGALLENRGDAASPEVRAEERNLRRRTLLAALLITIFGLLLGYGVWRAVDAGSAREPMPRWMPNLTGK